MCNSCEVLNINGLNCHETGCPEAWKDHKEQECQWCGFMFKKDTEYQKFCCEQCAQDYWN